MLPQPPTRGFRERQVIDLRRRTSRLLRPMLQRVYTQIANAVAAEAERA